MKKLKDVKLFIGADTIAKGKNTDGVLGEKCNNCGGFGFTMGLKGENLPCRDCEQTGVKLPTIRELQTEISDLRKDLHLLKKALLETLQSRGIEIKTDIKETTNV